MNAINKCRGKRVDNGEWVYGYCGCKINVYTEKDDCFIMIPTYNATTNSSYFVDVQVDPNTVGQYTGEKDKNGVEMCKGDIVKIYDKKIKVIDFALGAFVTRSRNVMSPMILIPSEMYEVIGNIHDNPELLEV